MDGSNLTVDFGYTGHYFHAPSGLNLTLYRAYNPEIGRWLSRDPMENAELLPEGPNLYSYVGNDPVKWIDPFGLALNDWYGFPSRDEHLNRNILNDCPKKEPDVGTGCDGKTWSQDRAWYARIKGGSGARMYRSDEGDECVYDRNGNLLLDAGSYNYTPDPITLGHIWHDILPHFWYWSAGPYTAGVTTTY